MAQFNKKTTTTEGVKTQVQEVPRVSSCRLAHDEKRPWLLAHASVAFEGNVFINGVQVRESKDGNAYLLLPGYRRVENGEPVKDENGYQQYVDFCNPITKETREKMQKAVFDAVQQVLDDESKEKTDIFVDDVRVRVYLRKGQDSLVASCSVAMPGTWAMRGIQVLEAKSGDAYLKFPYVYNKEQNKEFSHCGPGDHDTKVALDNLIMPAVQAEFDKQ